MVAPKSLLVTLAVVAAVGLASAQEADRDTQDCIKLLSNSLAGVPISQEVHEFMQLVRSTLPGVPTEDYIEITRDQRVEKLEAAFPLDECNQLLDQVDLFSMQAIGGNSLCQRILSDDESDVLELVKQDSVLAHVYEAKEACFAFPPQGSVH